MDINLINSEHLEANIKRLHKASTALAERASGVTEGELDFYPYIIRGSEGKATSHTSKKGTPDSDFFMPFVTNGSFTLEILLKTIIFYEKKQWIGGHNLIQLYQEVSTPSKRASNKAFKELCNEKHHKEVEKFAKDFLGKKLNWNLAFILESSAKAFEEWRYSFERGFSISAHKSSFLAYGEVFQVLHDIKESLRNEKPK